MAKANSKGGIGEKIEVLGSVCFVIFSLEESNFCLVFLKKTTLRIITTSITHGKLGKI